MTDKETVLRETQDIFRDIFDDENLVITEASSAKDIKEWDSIAQMDIVLAVEQHFRVKFRPEEIAALRNVGDMLLLVQQRQA